MRKASINQGKERGITITLVVKTGLSRTNFFAFSTIENI